MRQASVGRIGHDPQRRERDAVLGREPGRDVRLHVDRRGARIAVQGPLGSGAGHDAVHAREVGQDRVRKSPRETLQPRPVGRDAPSAIEHRAGQQHGAGPQGRRKAARDAEADHRPRAPLQRGPQQQGEAGRIAAARHGRDPRAARDPRFRREARDRNDRQGMIGHDRFKCPRGRTWCCWPAGS